MHKSENLEKLSIDIICLSVLLSDFAIGDNFGFSEPDIT